MLVFSRGKHLNLKRPRTHKMAQGWCNVASFTVARIRNGFVGPVAATVVLESLPFRVERFCSRGDAILLMPMKHTKVNRSWRNQVFGRGVVVSWHTGVLRISTYWTCFSNTLPTFMFHNVPCGWELYQTSSLPPGCASALGNAPATCCCLASQLRFCSSKALELPRRNYWGQESSEESVVDFYFAATTPRPPKKFSKTLESFSSWEYRDVSLNLFVLGGDASPQKWIGMNLGSWLFETHPHPMSALITLEPIISCPFSRMSVEQEGVD